MNMAFIAVALALLCLAGCVGPGGGASDLPPLRAQEEHLLMLGNEGIVVGILPQVGGRVLLLRRPGGRNVLLAYPDTWGEPAHERPEPTPYPDMQPKPYGGHITWVGPQEQWWRHQDLNLDYRQRGSSWPPDPYLTHGSYEVVERSETYAKLIGPKSPLTGVQLTKEITVKSDGTVTHRVTARNIRQTPVAWDIWSNTRMSPRTMCYVPVDSEKAVRWTNFPTGRRGTGPLPHEVVDGFFTFDVARAFPRRRWKASDKAFLRATEGVIAGFSGSDVFLKRTPVVPEADLHPSVAFVEIFQWVERNSDEGLTELEFHSVHRTLQPGESMSFEETWQVLPYDGARTAQDHVRFLTQQGIGRAAD